ncbi:MAG TPA: hypothetical protein VFT67_07300 [Jatrophihabitantaceae bacterium]|nr:hypothetical protein [Jatrophihabitantaceae bacterium]
MTFPSRRAQHGAVAVVLLVMGILLGGLYRVTSGTERHSYASDAVPPANVHVTAGHSYMISVPGGVSALQDRDLSPSGLRCEWSTGGSAAQPLSVQLYGPDSKATDAVGTFTAPITGDVHIDCTGWGAVFVDDADDAGGDLAGLFLVLCVIALTLGAALGLSALRLRHEGSSRDSARTASEDDEIERLVHIVHVRSEDGEVTHPDGGDVRP